MKQNKGLDVVDKLMHKYALKIKVHTNALAAFKDLKEAALKMIKDNKIRTSQCAVNLPYEYTDKGEFQFEMKFGSDVLVFMLHTNVFEFDRGHEVRKMQYIKEDCERSYCGLIQVYNFLSDSFKYERENDLGYLVARIFINKESHYFIEGKKEIGLLYNSFAVAEMSKDVAKQILESSMDYCINFDLLTPPFDDVKMVTVNEIVEYSQSMQMKTGKRLGFRFQADKE